MKINVDLKRDIINCTANQLCHLVRQTATASYAGCSSCTTWTTRPYLSINCQYIIQSTIKILWCKVSTKSPGVSKYSLASLGKTLSHVLLPLINLAYVCSSCRIVSISLVLCPYRRYIHKSCLVLYDPYISCVISYNAFCLLYFHHITLDKVYK